ncbi:unnamed protein product [Chrysoparadoxa australica]
MNTNFQTNKERSLKERIILTISLLTIIRLGNFIPLPFIDRETFKNLIENQSSSTNTIASLITTFSGGTNTSFGLFSLGILPYINASIIMQLLTTLLPSLTKLQKEEGEYGRRKITDYTRYLTFFWAIIESITVTYSLKSLIFDWNLLTAAQISLTLITGSMIVLWFSELITRNGLGNGSSLVICFNIVCNLPSQVKKLFFSLGENNNLNAIVLLLFFSVFLLTTIACVLVNEAVIKIPLISAKQLLRSQNFTDIKLSNNTTVLPLRINQAGIMPLIFTSSLMVLFTSGIKLLGNQFNNILFLQELINKNNENTIIFIIQKVINWGFYGGLIFFFTYFYSTLILDPKDVAEQFRKNSVTIKNIPPGNSTKQYLTQTLKRITGINALFLVSIIICLNGLEIGLKSSGLNLQGFGLTSQLILVNVLIDTVRRIRSFLNDNEKII